MDKRQIGNVLLITLDQWRGDCLSALGHPCLRTPHLDQLAADGVLFRRHYSQASPCGPARASLYTGLYPHNHRSVRNGVPLDDRHANVARVARGLGYHPLVIGYTDTSVDPRLYPPDHPALTTYDGLLPGFDFALALGEDLSPWLADLERKGHAVPKPPRPQKDIWLPRRQPGDMAGWGPTFAPTVYAAADSETSFVTDTALAYLRRQGGEPWFLHLSYYRPHPPFIAPEPYHARFSPAAGPPPLRRPDRAAEAAQHPWLAQQLDRLYRGKLLVQEDLPLSGLDERGLAQLRATYYGMIAEVDDAIGRLIAALRAMDCYEKTLIVVTSDHGEQLGDHWLFGKDGYFDATYHVPLILRDPFAEAAATRGRMVDRFSEAVDVMPTILDWFGAEIPPAVDGHSLRPFLRGETPADWRREVHWQYDFRDLREAGAEAALGLAPEQCALAVIRDERYKYVHFTAMAPLFFDLARDPGEFDNRAGDREYLPLLLGYAQKLLSWRMAHEDRTLTHLHLGPGGAVARPNR